MYPVASVNEKDFHNLMDVYLDAVFIQIYTRKKRLSIKKGGTMNLTMSMGMLNIKGLYIMR